MKKYKSLDEFFSDQVEPKKSEINELREIIFEAESGLKERLKWNAPSYYLNTDDRITFNLFNEEKVRIVIHAGAKRKEDKKSPPIFNDESGLLKWNSDIRATIEFGDIDDIHKKKKAIIKIIRKWLEIFG